MSLVKKLGFELAKLEKPSDPELEFELYENKYNKKAVEILQVIGLEEVLYDEDAVAQALIAEDSQWEENAGLSCNTYKTEDYARAVLRVLREKVY